MRDPKWNRYIRYYLSRFDIDEARIVRHSTQAAMPRYQLHVDNDKIVIEYLSPDKKTVTTATNRRRYPCPGTSIKPGRLSNSSPRIARVTTATKLPF